MEPITLGVAALIGGVAGFLLSGLGYKHSQMTKDVLEEFDVKKAIRAVVSGAVGGFLIVAMAPLFGIATGAGSMPTYLVAALGGLFGDEVIRKVVESFRAQAFGEE